jgi:hypothetical protein
LDKNFQRLGFGLAQQERYDQAQAHRLSIEGILGPAVQFIQTKGLDEQGIAC